MKTILSIFGRDLSRIGKNAMALIIAVGISVLPALYAWFNIAANWDPYGNTGAVSYTHLDVYKRQVLFVLCAVFCIVLLIRRRKAGRPADGHPHTPVGE